MVQNYIRQLREGLSRALRRVRAGETLEVTDHGRPVARLVPVAAVGSGLEELVTVGTLLPAQDNRPLPEPLDLRSSMSSEEAVAILRGGSAPQGCLHRQLRDREVGGS